MAQDGSFEALMAQLRAGDEDAASKVFHLFASRLIALARLHLGSRVGQKVDAEDVVQSVFKSFFRRHADGQFELRNLDSLWGLLVRITLRKCGRKRQHFYGPHHDVRKETAALPAGDDSNAGWEAMAREPTPEQVASLAETLEQLLRSLSERDRRILELRLHGYTVPEISREVGRTEFTVEGALKKVRKRLHAQLDKDEP
jgi:RNA polymerase sigma-70 factor (ECF subfamily)